MFHGPTVLPKMQRIFRYRKIPASANIREKPCAAGRSRGQTTGNAILRAHGAVPERNGGIIPGGRQDGSEAP